MHRRKAALSAGNGKTWVEGPRFRKQLSTEGFFVVFFLAASDRAFIVVRLCKRGERRRASAHNIQPLQDIHKHLYKQ